MLQVQRKKNKEKIKRLNFSCTSSPIKENGGSGQSTVDGEQRKLKPELGVEILGGRHRTGLLSDTDESHSSVMKGLGKQIAKLLVISQEL